MSVATWIDQTMARVTCDDCVVIVAETHEVNLRFARNALTTNGQMASRQGTVTAYLRGDEVRRASVSGPVAGPDDLAALLGQAERDVAGAPADPAAIPLVPGEAAVDFDGPAAETDLAVFQPLADGLGRAFTEAEAEGHLLFGFAEWARTTTWLATSAGVRRRVVEPMGRFEFTAKQPDFVNSAWVGQQTNDFSDVDVAGHHAELRRRLGWGARRVDLPAGDYETILTPGAVVDLMVYATWEMGARDAEDGNNAFAGRERGTTRIGERLASLPITMYSDPAEPRFPLADVAIVPTSMPGMTSVDDNGAPVGRTTWLEDGVLTSLVRTRANMAKNGLEGSLPFPVENLVMSGGGSASVEEMIRSTQRGLLVTCLWYIRVVDPQTLLLTGLTRDGVYLIEDGEVVGAVNNFRFNESPLSLLQRCTEVSAAEHTLCREWNDWFTRSIAPAMRVSDFHMSSVSQAH